MPPPVRSIAIFKRTLIAVSVGALFSTQAYAQDFELKDKIFENGRGNVYAFKWISESINDLNQIIIDNIEFKNMGGFDEKEGNGGLRLDTSNIIGTSTSKISVTNIKQTGQSDALMGYFGIKAEASTLKVNEIFVDNITTEAKLGVGVFGVHASNNLTYGKITIQNLSSNGGAVGLKASNLNVIDKGQGAVYVSNVTASGTSEAIGASITNASGNIIDIKNIISTVEDSDTFLNTNASGLKVDDLGKFNFDTINISGIHSTSGNGFGLTVDYRNDFSNKVLFVDSVSGVKSFGVRFGSDIHAEHPVNTEQVTVQNIGNETSDESLAID